MSPAASPATPSAEAISPIALSPIERRAAQRQNIVEIGAFVLLVGCGVATRCLLRDLPNFAPVAAVALFAGYFFRSTLVALSVPLLIMAISDIFIGAYDITMMALIYGSLSLPVAMRGLLRRTIRIGRGKTNQAVLAVAALLTCGFASSMLFFFISNLGVWLRYESYALTPIGLMECYVAALPFLRYTLTGDLLFSLVLFGGYALLLNMGLLTQATARPLSLRTS